MKGWTQVQTQRLEKMKVNEDTSESYLPVDVGEGGKSELKMRRV